ncbi:hypothetical protein D3C78_895120 [compost metagenome]
MAYSTVPDPRVATKLSISASATKIPFNRPYSAESASTVSTAICHEKPYSTCRVMARICHSTMPKPTLRSILPTIIGMVAASANRAIFALLERIACSVSIEANVGEISENRITSAMHSNSRP